MAPLTSDTSERERRLDEVLASYYDSVAAGQPIDRQAFIDRHQDLAAELATYFAAEDRIEKLTVPLRPLVAPGVPSADTAPPGRDLLGCGQTLGDYKLLTVLGRGGMGVVYEAEQLSLGRRVAIKVLPFAATLDARHLQRFHNEARAAASLEHPHIVPVYGVGCERGVHFYAMRLIDGRSVDALLRALRQAHSPEGSPAPEPVDQPAPGVHEVPPSAATVREPRGQASTLPSPRGGREYYRRAAELGAQAAEALEHAHQLGVVHRDIKPANLLVDGQGKLWVTDFGLAQIQSDARMTLTGDLLGTLRYMSPEQALGQRGVVDHRSDVYSLGATLYELLTLRPVFLGEDRQALLRQVAFEEPVPPRRVNRAIPAELETIVVKALEKNPQERYGTAQELADDLRRFLEDRPIQARRPTWAQRLMKWARRHQAVVLTASAAAVLGLIASVIATILLAAAYEDESLQRQTAEIEKDNAQQSQRKEQQERTKAEQAQKNEQRQRVKAERAADDERQAKAIADERRRQAEAVADLLESVFRNLDPYATQKGTPALKAQLIANLDDAAAQLERAAADPITQARLQNALGQAYLGLGAASKAVRQLERSYDTRQSQLGLDHADTLTTMRSLAHAYWADGRLDLALPLGVRAVEKLKATLGPDHPDTLASMTKVAYCHSEAGDLLQALPLCLMALARQKATLGPDHPDTLFTMAVQALIYLSTGRSDLALPLCLTGLEKQKATIGPDHPDTLFTMRVLADTYRELRKLDLAVPLGEQTLEKYKATLGPDHIFTLLSNGSLALTYQAAGRLDLALPMFEQILENARRILPDHNCTLQCMQCLADAYRVAGKHDLAVPLLEQVLAKQRAALGSDHRRTLTTMNNLAVEYHDAGKLDLAVPLYEQAVEMLEAKLGRDHPNTLKTMGNLAQAYKAAGKLDLAVSLLEQTLPTMKAKLGPDHPNTLWNMGNLAGAYQAAGKLDMALALHEETLNLRKAKLGHDHPDTLSTMNKLANAYQDAGKLDLAEPLLRDLAAARKKVNGANHLTTADALAQLAMNHLQQHKYVEAEPLLRDCLKIREDNQPDVWNTFSTQSMLGGSLLGQKKVAEAEPLLLKGYEGMKARDKTIPPQSRPRLTEAAQRLVELYEAVGNKNLAEQWRQRALELSKGSAGEKKK